MNQSVGQTVSRNFAVLLARQIATWTSTFVLLMFLPRYLGPIGYGRYYLAFSITAMFALLIDFGGRFLIPKEVSRNREQVASIIANAAVPRFGLWLLSFIGILVYAWWADYHPSVSMMLVILGAAQMWQGIRMVLWGAYQGMEMMHFPSYGIVAQTVFVMAVAVPALILGIDPVGFTVILAAGTLLDFLINVRFLPRLGKMEFRMNWTESRRGLKESVPYFLNSMFGVIYYRIDTVMLSMMTPEVTVGWYGAAYRFFDALMFVPSLFSMAVYPALARMWGEKSDSMTRSMQKSLDFIMLAGIPVSVGTFMFAEQIIQLFMGLDGYRPAILLLQIFSAGILLVYVDIVLGSALLASDQQRKLSIVSLTAIGVNVTANYFAIPYTHARFGNGGIGASVATFITEFVILTAMTFLMDRTLMKSLRVGVQLKALGAGGMMVASVLVMHFLDVPWGYAAAASAPVYLGSLALLRAIEPSDMALLKHVLSPLLRPRKASA